MHAGHAVVPALLQQALQDGQFLRAHRHHVIAAPLEGKVQLAGQLVPHAVARTFIVAFSVPGGGS